MENLESHGILEFHFPAQKIYGKNVPKMRMVKFRSSKTWRSTGKGHGKSWNFKSSKEYEPCLRYPFDRTDVGTII